MLEAKRRLATIMAADVAGYSRLMGDDERATLETLDAYRMVFTAQIASHDGRVVDTAGDSVLAVFDSVVEAVACGVAVQDELAERNADLDETRRMVFRIGINIGDVIVKDDGTIYGDGVNVAARLEGLAEPGRICISDSTRMQVQGKLDIGFEDIGQHEVKNITVPVRAYYVRSQNAVPVTASGSTLTLPGKPSIAVLPFDNLSGDPEQEYFADGIAEDIITGLSQRRWLFVTARNSTFAYRGKSSDVRQIGKELGARYVLEGSVRRGGRRVRVTAQLIDATNGNHVWAQRYDRELEDIFAVQDEITDAIVSSIGPQLEMAERGRARRKPPESLDAWESYQLGLSHFYRFDRENNLTSQELLSRAADLDKSFSSPLAALAWSHLIHSVFGFTDQHEECRKAAFEAAQAALACDEADAMAHAVLCRINFVRGDFASAVESGRKAVTQSPNLAIAHFYLGGALAFLGQGEDGLREIDDAIRLSPYDPYLWGFETNKAMILIALDRYDEAHGHTRKAISYPGAKQWAYALHASILGHLGRDAQARAALKELLRFQPDFSYNFVAQAYPGWPRDFVSRLFNGLRKAGFAGADGRTAAD